MEKKNLLVLPGLFPHFKGDTTGIFVLDYITAVQPYCNTTVLFLRLFGEPGLKTEEENGVKVIRYCLVRKNRFLSLLKPVLYLLLQQKGKALAKSLTKPHVIHAHGAPLNGSLALKLRGVFNVPVILTEHTGPFSKLTQRASVKMVTKKIIESVDVFLTVSNDLKEQVLAEGFTPKKMMVSFNPVDTDLFQIKNNTPLGERKLISFCGRLEGYKGGLRVVKAFAKAIDKLGDYKLCIIGHGHEENQIKEFIEQNNLSSRVQIVGKADKVMIEEVYNRSSFFVFPSEHETFGLVIAEAMSCGLPVIVGTETAPKEIVEKGQGLLVNPTDVDAIASAMVTMKNNLGTYNSTNIRNSIINRFGFKSFGIFLNDVYDNAIKDFKN
jgi:glycosyltransferase involved in cell wall biosynthesis